MLRLQKVGWIAASITLAMVASAKAALEVAAGKVNTSVGLAHTAANAWALETDPQEVDPTLVPFYPLSGSLNNSYDPTQFSLNTDPDGQYALGYSVQGLNYYEVTSFEVLFKGQDEEDSYSTGYPYVLVTEDPSHPGDSIATDVANGIGDMPDLADPIGQVDDITFNLIASDKNLATSVTQDQLFFQLNLTQLSEVPTITDPEYSVFGNQTSFLTIEDPSGDQMTTTFDPTGDGNGGPTIVASYLPEPASLGIGALASMVLLSRRRRS